MKEHPGHFAICFWLFLILMFGTVDKHTSDSLDHIAATLERINTKLERLP